MVMHYWAWDDLHRNAALPRITPTIESNIIIQLRPFGVLENDRNKAILPLIFYTGPMSTWWNISTENIVNGAFFAIRLQPRTAFQWFRLETDPFLDQFPDLLEILPELAYPLLDACYGTTSFEGRVQAVESVLKRLRRLTEPNPLIRLALQRLNANTNLSIRELAAGLSISPRHLERLFHLEFGMAPKSVQKLARLRRTQNNIPGFLKYGLANLAMQMGFSDQAHMTREFRHFTGFTPSSWFKEHFTTLGLFLPSLPENTEEQQPESALLSEAVDDSELP